MYRSIIDKYFIGTCLFIIVLGMLTVAFPDGSSALLIVIFTSTFFLYVFRRYAQNKDFITKLFLAALIVRLAFGIFIHIFDLRVFFGGDANTYHALGLRILEYWQGVSPGDDPFLLRATDMTLPGWGMNYLTAAIYGLLGPNIFVAQSFCAVIGAATAPLVYFCSLRIFNNDRVAKVSAFAISFFPSFVIWSSQLLKDGLIIFLLVLAVLMVLNLHEKFDLSAVILLVGSLFGVLSLRFYIFYMLAAAVAGTFVIGVSKSSNSLIRRTLALIVLGLSLTYLGVLRTASVSYEKYSNLEQLQSSRSDLAQSAESGFGSDVDVSTTEGAIQQMPVGFAYLMFAPFPWQMSNFRQLVTLPEVLIWWALIPWMIFGIGYTVRHKLRVAMPILIFSLMLTLAYSVFQGNVGTAYRQRTQIQVFLFMFIAVGWELRREKKEDERELKLAKRRGFENRIRGGRVLSN
jgi:hypothetical protein